MTTRALKDVMQRAETWPEEAQQELAEIASEIEAELNERRYHATTRELDGIDRGIKAAREGRFVTDEDGEAGFAKHRQRSRMRARRGAVDVVYSLGSAYPAVFMSFERRLLSAVRRIAAWPDSAQQLAERPGVRVAPLKRRHL